MESLKDFFHRQQVLWSDKDLSPNPAKREVYGVTLLYNPARKRSTAAKVDSESIAKRPCFLCSKNRLPGQLEHPGLSDLGFTILVNPFPILPYHFTVVYDKHIPQELPLNAMYIAAKRYPEFVFFYNSSNAGASAPDHLHFQAVPKDFIPLIAEVENIFDGHSEVWSSEIGIKHPVKFRIGKYLDVNKEDRFQNVFIWFSEQTGHTITCVFPRSAHRANSYPHPMISPGALDVAGLIVTVQEEDFNNVTEKQLEDILKQTCYTPTQLHQL